MLVNAMNQMLCSNDNIIKNLNNELMQVSLNDDKIFWNTIKFQEKIIKLYKNELKEIK